MMGLFRFGLRRTIPTLMTGFVAAAAWAEAPRLAIVIAVDQLPYDQLARYRAGLAEDGFFAMARERGAWVSDCRYEHAWTVTGAGHAVLMTGANPDVHGVIGNDWYDRAAGKSFGCVEDPEFPTLSGAPDDGVSPRKLLAPTVGDVLKLESGGRSKVFGLAIKDRAGVLMSGASADASYWFEPAANGWFTSRYYRDELPAWVREFNASDAISRYAGATWELLRAPAAYRLFMPDDNEFEGAAGPLGKAFPHRMPPDDGKGMYRQLIAPSPFGSELALAFARKLIESEQLGADDDCDLLNIGLSSNDYVGHVYGPHSLEVQDMLFRTDALLGEFVRYLEARCPRRWVLALSSDHGVAPIPEYAASLRLAARREKDDESLRETLSRTLAEKLNVSDDGKPLVQKIDGFAIYLDRERHELAGAAYAEAQRIVRDELLKRPEVAAAFTREQLIGDAGGDSALLARYRRTFHPKRSGDVLIALRPYHIESGNRATHGSPWGYDAHVPLVFLGQGVVPGRTIDAPSTPSQLAPTLARLLRIPRPPACDALPLPVFDPDDR